MEPWVGCYVCAARELDPSSSDSGEERTRRRFGGDYASSELMASAECVTCGDAFFDATPMLASAGEGMGENNLHYTHSHRVAVEVPEVVTPLRIDADEAESVALEPMLQNLGLFVVTKLRSGEDVLTVFHGASGTAKTRLLIGDVVQPRCHDCSSGAPLLWRVLGALLSAPDELARPSHHRRESTASTTSASTSTHHRHRHRVNVGIRVLEVRLIDNDRIGVVDLNTGAEATSHLLADANSSGLATATKWCRDASSVAAIMTEALSRSVSWQSVGDDGAEFRTLEPSTSDGSQSHIVVEVIAELGGAAGQATWRIVDLAGPRCGDFTATPIAADALRVHRNLVARIADGDVCAPFGCSGSDALVGYILRHLFSGRAVSWIATVRQDAAFDPINADVLQVAARVRELCREVSMNETALAGDGIDAAGSTRRSPKLRISRAARRVAEDELRRAEENLGRDWGATRRSSRAAADRNEDEDFEDDPVLRGGTLSPLSSRASRTMHDLSLVEEALAQQSRGVDDAQASVSRHDTSTGSGGGGSLSSAHQRVTDLLSPHSKELLRSLPAQSGNAINVSTRSASEPSVATAATGTTEDTATAALIRQCLDVSSAVELDAAEPEPQRAPPSLAASPTGRVPPPQPPSEFVPGVSAGELLRSALPTAATTTDADRVKEVIMKQMRAVTAAEASFGSNEEAALQRQRSIMSNEDEQVLIERARRRQLMMARRRAARARDDELVTEVPVQKPLIQHPASKEKTAAQRPVGRSLAERNTKPPREPTRMTTNDDSAAELTSIAATSANSSLGGVPSVSAVRSVSDAPVADLEPRVQQQQQQHQREIGGGWPTLSQDPALDQKEYHSHHHAAPPPFATPDPQLAEAALAEFVAPLLKHFEQESARLIGGMRAQHAEDQQLIEAIAIASNSSSVAASSSRPGTVAASAAAAVSTSRNVASLQRQVAKLHREVCSLREEAATLRAHSCRGDGFQAILRNAGRAFMDMQRRLKELQAQQSAKANAIDASSSQLSAALRRAEIAEERARRLQEWSDELLEENRRLARQAHIAGAEDVVLRLLSRAGGQHQGLAQDPATGHDRPLFEVTVLGSKQSGGGGGGGLADTVLHPVIGRDSKRVLRGHHDPLATAETAKTSPSTDSFRRQREAYGLNASLHRALERVADAAHRPIIEALTALEAMVASDSRATSTMRALRVRQDALNLALDELRREVVGAEGDIVDAAVREQQYLNVIVGGSVRAANSQTGSRRPSTASLPASGQRRASVSSSRHGEKRAVPL